MRGTVLVAGVVAMLLLSSSGCLGRYPRPDHDQLEGAITFSLENPELSEESPGRGTWSALWVIRRITNSYVDEDDPQDQEWWDEMRIKWRELHVAPSNGSGDDERVPLAEYGSAPMVDGIQAWYEDTADPSNGPDPGDGFWISGLDPSCGGAMFRVVYTGEWYGGYEQLCILLVPEGPW